MGADKISMFTLVLTVVAFAAGYFLSGVGRYEIVLDKVPGEYGRFLLLDTRDGDVFMCDRTACRSKALER